MSRLVPVWLCAVVALVALTGAPGFHPAPVIAASGTLRTETPLHDSPDPAAPVIALLSEGTTVSIDGPPVDGFYPVTAENLSGWMRGETLQVEKDLAASDDAEEMAVDAPLEETDETVPVEAPAALDPSADPAMLTTVEPATDPAVDPSATMEPSPPVTDPAREDETVATPEPVPAEGMPSGNEPVPVDAAAPAPDLASTGDVTPVPTTPDGAVPPPDSAAPAPEVATEPTIAPIVTAMPVADVAAVGPASVIVDAPILAGPGPEYGFIATAPAGSTVEKTGHVINGYATVQYAEVTGWLALAHLGVPGAAPPPGEAAAPTEMPPADAVPAETPPPALAPTETLPAESVPTETLPVETPPETPPAATAPAETAPVESATVVMAPVEAAPVDVPPSEVAPVNAP